MAGKEFMKLVEQAIQGKDGAFDELCRQKAKEILYICIRLMGNYQDGEDVAQEVLLYMQAHIEELKHVEAFHVWMYRIIKGKCSNMKRKNNKRILPLEDYQEDVREDRAEFLPYEVAMDEAKREQLLEVIDELPFLCKMCVYMFYFDNLSYEKIADVLEISKKDVDNTLTKSKRLIRRRLEEKEGSEDFLRTVRSVAPVPVLLTVLAEDIDHLVRGQSVENVLTGCSISLSADAGITGTVGKGMEAAGKSGNPGAAGAVKMVLAAAVVVGIGIGIFAYTRQPGSEQPEVIEEVDESDDPQMPSAEEETVEAESDIHTLEDMIGDDPATELKDFEQEAEVNLSHVRKFLDDQDIVLEENLWREEAEVETTLYTLQRQNKLLMVITRDDRSKGSCGLAYKFTNVGESIPEDIDIVFAYEEWKTF